MELPFLCVTKVGLEIPMETCVGTGPTTHDDWDEFSRSQLPKPSRKSLRQHSFPLHVQTESCHQMFESAIRFHLGTQSQLVWLFRWSRYNHQQEMKNEITHTANSPRIAWTDKTLKKTGGPEEVHNQNEPALWNLCVQEGAGKPNGMSPQSCAPTKKCQWILLQTGIWVSRRSFFATGRYPPLWPVQFAIWAVGMLSASRGWQVLSEEIGGPVGFPEVKRSCRRTHCQEFRSSETSLQSDVYKFTKSVQGQVGPIF